MNGRRRALSVLLCCALSRPCALGQLPRQTPTPDLHPFQTRTSAGTRYGYIDHTGRVAIPPRFEDALDFQDGLASVRIGRFWGAIDATGELRVPAEHAHALWYQDGLAAESLDEHGSRYVFVDRQGRRTMPPQSGPVQSPFSEGLSVQFTCPGYMDRSGRCRIRMQPGWHELADFHEGLAAVRVGEDWGFINKNGRLVIPARFQRAYTYFFQAGCLFDDDAGDPPRFSERLAAVKVGKLAGFIDWTGRVVIEPRFEAALPFSEGRAAIREGGKWGFVDRSGAVIIEPRFDEVREFSEGLAAVRQGKHWGYIDPEGAVAIQPQYKHVLSFHGGLAKVFVGGKSSIYIDMQGRKVQDLPTR